jgi:hypothetical protein
MKQLEPNAVTRFGIRRMVIILGMPVDFVAIVYFVSVDTVQQLINGLKPRSNDDSEIANLLKEEAEDRSRMT